MRMDTMIVGSGTGIPFMSDLTRVGERLMKMIVIVVLTKVVV